MKYFKKELVIYTNGKFESSQFLTINSLYPLNYYKVKIKTKNKEYIGYLDIDFDKEKNIFESNKIRIIIGKSNTKFEKIYINFNDICNIYCIKYITFNDKDINFNFEPKNEINNNVKWLYDNNITINKYIPYSVVHQGSHIDGYARGRKSKPYICSCYKKAIENMVKLYEKYLQYDAQIKDRDELLLENLGLPHYYEEIIRKSQTHWSMEWIKYIKFKDGLCPICCQTTFTHKESFNKYTSNITKSISNEIRKRYLQNGVFESHILNGLPYVLEDEINKNYRKYFILSDKVIIKELTDNYGIDVEVAEKNILMLNKLNKELKHDYLFNSKYYNKQEVKNKINSLQVDENFDNAIYNLYLKNFRAFKKSVKDEINLFEKETKESYKAGKLIDLTIFIRNDINVYFRFDKVKEIIEIIIVFNLNKSSCSKKVKINDDIFTGILNILNLKNNKKSNIYKFKKNEKIEYLELNILSPFSNSISYDKNEINFSVEKLLKYISLNTNITQKIYAKLDEIIKYLEN